MDPAIVKFKNWTFEVDLVLTENTYRTLSESGAETCTCTYCRNYVAYRDRVFPDLVLDLFKQLGINYKREVEVTTWEICPDGLHHIGGWFHFRGRILSGNRYLVPLPSGGETFDLTPIAENFSIGFSEQNDLTFFEDKNGLVQVEFDTNIPWVIDKSLEPDW